MNKERKIICDAVKIGSYEEVSGIPAKNLTKVDTDTAILDGLIVKGYETKFGELPNENGEIYTKDCFDDFLDRYYIKNNLNIPVVVQHRDDLAHLVGRVLILEVNSVGFYFVCYIPRMLPQYDNILTLVKEGVLQGLSKYGWATKYHYDERKQALVIDKMDLANVSLVSNPANAIPFEKLQEVTNGLSFRKLEDDSKGFGKGFGKGF